jgi:hypothetical protein
MCELGLNRLLGMTLAAAVLGVQALQSLPALAFDSAGPTVIQSLKNDTSPALRTLQASPVLPAGKGNQSHRPLHPGQSGANLPTAGSIQTKAGAAAMPSTNTNFEGINNIDGVLPPDTNGDVGPNNYVQWVNLHYQVFDRTGASLLGPSPGNVLWSGFGGLCETTNQGDPVVRYDRMANRWVFTQFAFAVNHQNQPVAPFVQCFAVSTTGDPTGTYYRYSWNTGYINGTNYFPDYPKLAVWPDAYYMTVNYFSGNTFVGGGALAFDRSKMLNGQAAAAIGYGPLGAAYGGSLPSDLDGSILPPSGSPNYFGAIDTNTSPSGSTFQIWKFHVDFATPANSTFGLTSSHTPNFNLAVATYFWNMCSGSRNCIQQPGTSVGLDPIGDRLMNRLQYRRFSDGHESLVANHTVGVGSSNNQAAIRWYEIRNLSTTPTIYEQGTYAPGTDSRWMGSIAMDQSGDMALGYSVSSSTISPSIRYTGRLAGDPLGSLPQSEATLIAGSGSQTNSLNRWGDYSMMAVDPTDDCTFWYTQEYYATTSNAGWQTRIGSFKFPNCGQAWFASYGTANTSATWTANQTQTYGVTVTNNGTQTWTAASNNPVHLGVHFTNGSGTWYTDQRFNLPMDLAPGASANLTIGVTAPGNSGTLVVEYQMVKESQFWFTQAADVSVSVAAANWLASYTVPNTPTTWAANQTQPYTVTVSNGGNQAWTAAGSDPVHLGVHFTNGAGTWYSDQRFNLPNDLAPGAGVTLTISVTAPGNSGSLVLEYQMVKESQFWFTQVSDVTVNVAAASWGASYTVTNTPTSWAANQTQTYTMTVTNNGNQTWPATGTNPVHLGVHFKNGSGTWYTDQRFNLPGDLAPSASVTLSVSVTAPNTSGSLVLEYQMVKESQFWFTQFADVSVSVTAAIWAASYSVANTPTSWSANQTLGYDVTITNSGNQAWVAGGNNPVRLGVHFANAAGGYGTNTWYTDQRFALGADLAPGAQVTLHVSVTAPSNPGNVVVEYQMVKESQFWFGQFADVNVQVH